MEKYGLSRSQFDDMLVAQNYLCKICKKVDLRKVDPRRVHVDHDHATGKVRGILCRDCNLMLGNAKDNPHILKNAAKYLAA